MNNKEIRGLSVEQLREQISQEQEALSRLRFAHATSPIENPMRIRQSRKQIARMLTELAARQKTA